MLVPLGRVNRGIQTQAGEIWASTGAAGAAGTTAAAYSARLAHSATAAGSAAVYAAQCSSTSSSTTLLTIAGGDLSAEADPEAAAGSLLGTAAGSSRMQGVQRRAPAFTQHGGHRLAGSGSAAAAGCAGSLRATKGHATSFKGTTGEVALSGAAAADPEAALLAAVVELLAAGDVHLLPHGELLRLISSLYESKAAADARALGNHTRPQSLWAFVLRQLLGPPDSNNSGSSSNNGCSGEAVIAMAQLLGSAQAHAAASKEVAAFEAALMDSIPYSVAVAAGLPVDGTSSGSGSTLESAVVMVRLASSGGGGGAGSQDGGRSSSLTPRSAGRVSIFRATWGEVSIGTWFAV